MLMTDTALNGTRAPTHDAAAGSAVSTHANRSEHLANERTHLAYVRTAISLISLGITVNRFSLYLRQHDELPTHPERIDFLGGAASAGIGMVVFALALLLVALHRYKAVDESIDTGTYHPDRPLVVVLTLSVVLAGAGGILWMFRQ
jgi:putative membrane protein